MITKSLILLWSAYFFMLYIAIFWFLVFLEKGIKDKEATLKKFPYVTVAIPAYNEEKNIKETINSVLNLDYPKDKFELVIVNDGSTDKTEETVKEIIRNREDFNIKLFSQKNSGKGAALNKALFIAKGEFFAPLDADSTIRGDALKKILPVFADENTAAVLPLMKVKDPKSILQRLQWCEYLINLFYKKLMASLDCIHVAPGPFSTYRKSVIKQLGGFDENNLTEDLEITLRLQKHNYKIVQLFNTEVYTKSPRTFKELYKQRNRWYKGTIINVLKYKKMLFNKNYGDFGFIQLPRVLLEGFIFSLAIFVLLFNGTIRPFFKGLYNLSFINFNILPKLKLFAGTFSMLDVNLTNLFFTLVTFIVILCLLICAYKYTKEHVRRKDVVSILSYILLYPLLTSIIFFGVFLDLILNKKQKW